MVQPDQEVCVRQWIVRSNLRTIIYYAFFGFLWILLTDWLLANLNFNAQVYGVWQTYKGWFFVATNTLLLYLLLTYASNRDRAAQIALKASEATYQLIFQSNPLPMWIYDLETLSFLAVNNAAIDKYGYARKDFLTMTIRDIRPPEDLALLENDIRTTTQTLNHAGEWRHRRQDGTVFPVEITSHQLAYNGHQARLVVAYDISERKQAETERETLVNQLQAQAEQLVQIMHSVPEGILLLDGEGRIRQANPRAAKQVETFGVMQGDLLVRLGGQPLNSLLTSPPGGNLYHEVHATSRTYEVNSRPVETGPIPVGWVLSIRDVTQERTVAEQLRRQERLAAVGQLAAGIAHDFNNILSVIVMYAGMMARLDHLGERDRERLKIIYQQALQASQMIGQILDFSRSSVMEAQPFDLLPLLKEQIKLLQRTLPESIEVTLTAAPGEYTTRIDPTRMAQVVMNLAVNARDAMPKGGMLSFDLAQVEFAADKETPLAGMSAGKWVRLLVSDTGVGMSAEVQAHLFEPFFTTKAPGYGTGLGLAQVYGIVHQHNGHIGVSSQEGAGSTFVLYLPDLNLQQSGSAAVPNVDAEVQGQGERILLVEDEPTLRDALVEMLSLWNYEVVEAANGEEALARLSEASIPFDLILSDVVMPKMGGVALFHSLVKHKLTLPMILLTGYPMHDELEKLKSAGLRAWLTKPVKAQQLAEAIATVFSHADNLHEPPRLVDD
jgi:PAS domain S-box-containing protein